MVNHRYDVVPQTLLQIWQALDMGPVWIRHSNAIGTTIDVAVEPPLPVGQSEQKVAYPIDKTLNIVEFENSESKQATNEALYEPEHKTARAHDFISQLDWQALQTHVVNCQSCHLCQTRTQTVFGSGNAKASWLLIGEAPGEEEDASGLPFVGRAGQLLTQILAALQFNRDQDVYIANVLKCRPPNNRNPHADEVTSCFPYLQRQIEVIAPKMIVLMGRFAAQAILQTDDTIAQLRGKVHRYQGIDVVVTYHPSYLLRTPKDKAKAWQDWRLAYQVMDQAVTIG